MVRNTRIEARNMCVDFPVLTPDNRSLRRSLLNAYQNGRISVESRGRVTVKALRNVSFEFRDGDRIGLIGRNGAGKTTLLRALAGVYEPTSGHLTVSGNVVPLLNIGIGIRDDSTGLENIRICGLLLGMTIPEIEKKTDEIAAFTELGEYLMMPLTTYSSGMRMRLAFGIATAVEPDILLIDETFGAGDAAFIKKAEARMNQLIEQSRIVVFASHATEIIRRDCKKAMLLDQGEIRTFGPTEDVLHEYELQA